MPEVMVSPPLLLKSPPRRVDALFFSSFYGSGILSGSLGASGCAKEEDGLTLSLEVPVDPKKPPPIYRTSPVRFSTDLSRASL